MCWARRVDLLCGRTSTHPRGLPNLSGNALQQVRLGNRLADFSAGLAKLCLDSGVIGVEENPYMSYLWNHGS